jgi:hypothetical protein
MTTETPENTEQTTEQQEQQADKDFAAGFDDVRGNEHEEKPPVEEKPEPAAEARNDKGQFTKTEQPSGTEAITAPTVDDLKLSPEMKALIEKVPGLEKQVNLELNRVVGKFGNFQGRLDRIEKLLSQPGKKLQPGALKRLKQEFPELAAVLEPDLLEALTSPEPESQQAAKPEDFDHRIKTAVESAISSERQSTQKTVLAILHPDWEQLSVDPEFSVVARDAQGNAVRDEKGNTIVIGGWLSTLSHADREKYQHSDNALVIAEAFTKFKDWKKSAGVKPQPQKSARNQERLAAAVAPTGDGKPPTTALDDEAAFLEGFKTARGRG